MQQVLVFGAGELAQVLCAYLETDSDSRVAAFVVDAGYDAPDTLLDRPVLNLDDAGRHFPPGTLPMLVAIGYSRSNQGRRDKAAQLRAMGYASSGFIHSSNRIHESVSIGDGCIILTDNAIHPFARIGDNVVINHHNVIGHHSLIGDYAYLTSRVVVGGNTQIERQCFLGLNSTIGNGLRVGARCIVGAGVVMRSDAAPDGVYAAPKAVRSRVSSNRVRL
jgi:sugar O-acyltransferase (sialic acid O-acetyltransferase NeuD family)